MMPADCEEGQTDKDVNKPRGSDFPESSNPDKTNGKLSLTMTVSNVDSISLRNAVAFHADKLW